MTDVEDYAAAAACRVHAAERLRRMEMHPAAWLLLREACLLASKARCDTSPYGSADTRATPIEPALDRRLLEARELDAVSAAKLPGAELLQRITELEADVSRLLRDLGPTAVPRWSHKPIRWIVGVISVLIVTGLLVIYAKLFPNNIALHKRVTQNGVADYGTTTPYAIIDGRTYGPLGYHSDSGPDRSVTIDLGRVHRISGGEVWGRHDGAFDQSMPLALEVSNDDTLYTIVATRSEPFEAHAPWKPSLHSVEGRYIRLRVLRNSVLVLNEVRLFGHPVRR